MDTKNRVKKHRQNKQKTHKRAEFWLPIKGFSELKQKIEETISEQNSKN